MLLLHKKKCYIPSHHLKLFVIGRNTGQSAIDPTIFKMENCFFSNDLRNGSGNSKNAQNYSPIFSFGEPIFIIRISDGSNNSALGNVSVKVTAVGYLLMKEYSHYLDLHREPRIDDRSGHNFFWALGPRSGLFFRYMDPWFCFGFEITDLTFLTRTMTLVLNFRVSTTPNTTPLPDLYQVVLYKINFEVLVMFWNSIFQYLEMKRKSLK